MASLLRYRRDQAVIVQIEHGLSPPLIALVFLLYQGLLLPKTGHTLYRPTTTSTTTTTTTTTTGASVSTSSVDDGTPPLKKAPGPFRWPIVGNQLSVAKAKGLQRYFVKLREKYGTLAKVRDERRLVLPPRYDSSPEAIK